MLPPKKKASFAQQLLNTSFNAQETAPKGIAEVSATNIANTSESQVIKAESSSTGEFSKVLFQESAEQKAMRQYEAEQIKKEQARIPKAGSIEELHAQKLGDPAKFAAFQDREEELEKLSKKSLWENVKQSFNETLGAVSFGMLGTEEIKPWQESRTSVEDKKYEETLAKRNKELMPTIKEKLKLQAFDDAAILKKEQEIRKKSQDLTTALGFDKVGGSKMEFSDIYKTLFTGDSYEGGKIKVDSPEEKQLKSLNAQLHLLNLAKKQNEEATKKMTDFTENKTSMWDGLLNSKRDLKTIGMQSLVTNH